MEDTRFELLSLNADLPPTTDGDNSSVSSLNEGCESLSSSWDSEPETDIPSFINCDGMPGQGSLQGINLEENYLDIEEQNQFVGVENMDDGLLWEMDNRSYDDLVKKYLEKEEELRVSDFKLHSSEQEIIKLIAKVHSSEARCDDMCAELKLKEEELNILKKLVEEEILRSEEELKIQKELSEKAVLHFKRYIEKGKNQLNNLNEELKLKEKELNKQKEVSEEEISKLKTHIEKTENQLFNVTEELKLKQEELNKQKEVSEKEIFKLNIQIKKTENQLFNVNKELKRKEEELNVQEELSEEEISKLKTHIEKSETQLDNVNEELKLKEEKLNKQKALSGEEIARLNIEIVKSKNRLDNVQEALNLKVEKLQKQIAELVAKLEKKSSETHQLQGQLKVTQENMAKSELELVSARRQNQTLVDFVKMYEANETKQEQEVQKLKSELLDAQAKELKIEIELTSKLEDCNSRNKELKNKLRQYEAEKLNQEELHATQKIVLQDEIMALRQELEQRMDDEEATNKKLDMVMIELDEANVMIDNFKAEICSRDDKISNMKKYTHDVKTSLKDLMVEYNRAQNEAYNVNLRVVELEKEVTRQNGVISDMAEEKKEAIRQLCCSLEDYKNKLDHYKNGYNELVQTLYG